MEIGSLSNASSEAQVIVLNSARKQEEAVVGKILEGVKESSPRAPEQSGQTLNIQA